MLPKLLSKRDIDIKKAQERHRDVEEGAKLARTIDSLRELRVKEEKEFEDWRTSTVAHIQGEINIKIDERNALDDELRGKREEREALMRPLTQRWAALELEKSTLDQRIATHNEAEANLRVAIALNIHRERENNAKAEYLEVQQRKVAQIEKGLVENTREATQTLANAQATEAKVLKELKEREAELDERSSNLDYRESGINIRIEVYGKKEQDLLRREKLLQDRTALLERNIKRAK